LIPTQDPIHCEYVNDFVTGAGDINGRQDGLVPLAQWTEDTSSQELVDAALKRHGISADPRPSLQLETLRIKALAQALGLKARSDRKLL
jgi:hypothetical protein